MHSTASVELIQRLLRSRMCLSVSGDRVSRELESQKQSQRRLLSKVDTGSEIERFLVTYDLLMRTVETWLLHHGAKFGEQPHAALKAIVNETGVAVGNFAIDDLVNIRHNAKKRSVPIPEQALNVLGQLLDAVSRELRF